MNVKDRMTVLGRNTVRQKWLVEKAERKWTGG